MMGAMTGWTDAAGVLTGPVAVWALDSATDAIIVIDADGLVRGWNRACETLFGYPKAQALGRDVDFMIPLRLREAHHRAFSAAMERGRLASDGHARRTRALRADGGAVYVDMTFGMITDDAGRAIGSIAVARPSPGRE